MTEYLKEARELLEKIKALAERIEHAGNLIYTRLANFQEAEIAYDDAKAEFELWATTADDPIKNGIINLFAGKNEEDRKRAQLAALGTYGDNERWDVNNRKVALDEAESAYRLAQRDYDSLCKQLDALKLHASVLTILVAHTAPITDPALANLPVAA
jgi:hypothetical protein